jgi:hypothetical protein
VKLSTHPSNADVKNGRSILSLPSHVFMAWPLINSAQEQLYLLCDLNEVSVGIADGSKL